MIQTLGEYDELLYSRGYLQLRELIGMWKLAKDGEQGQLCCRTLKILRVGW